jgi:hypothetical protein
VSGDLAGKHCPQCRNGWFIGGVLLLASCQVHQKIGDYELEAIDDAGRVSVAKISVRLAVGK